MFCKHCGSEVTEEAKVCPDCGGIIGEAETPAAADGSANENLKTDKKAENKQKTDQAPKQKADKPKKEKRVGRGILSVMCCLLIFVMCVVTLTVATFRDSIEPEKIESLVEEFDVASFVELASDGKLISTDLSSKEMEKIYENSTFDKFIEKTLNEYAAYILEGDKPDTLDGEAVVELIRDDKNKAAIEKVIDRELGEYDENSIMEYFDSKEVKGVLSVKNNGAWTAVSIFASLWALIGYIVIIIGICLLMFFCIRKRRADTLMWCGVTFVIPAVVFAVFGAIKPIILSVLGGISPIVKELIDLYMGNILWPVLKNSGILLLVGALMIVIFSLIKKFSTPKNISADE